MNEFAEIAQSAIEAARSFVNGGKELVEATGQSPRRAMNALLDNLQEELDAALAEVVWSAAFVNGLPDSSFALILPGGEKDEDGKTKPRALRKLPYKDASGKVDLPHLRNALARAPQMKGGSAEQKAAAVAKLKAAAKKHLESYKEDENMEQSEAEAPAVVVSPETVRAVLKFLWTRYGEEKEEAPQQPAPPSRPAEEAEEEAEEVAEAELAESSAGQIIGLAEDIATATARESIVPLKLNVAIIQPGWGNSKDGHYYPSETLRRDSAAVFPGIKMHESDHRDDEKSTRTWVSTVDEITGFTEGGAPIGRVIVHDKGFAERILALNAAGMLGKMECSILGTGKVRKGEIDGRKGKIVEAITNARNVDWVTRAGAGGRALNLAEMSGGDDMSEEHQEQEQVQEEKAQEAEVTMLSEDTVTAILSESTLPDAARAKLQAAEYEDEEAVNGAIAAEVKYLKEITDAGKPVTRGDREQVAEEPMSEADYETGLNSIWQRHGLEPLYSGGEQA
jgi:hypothetical protein